jgi:hypothetical protein
MTRWLLAHWVAAALCMGLFLIALMPVLAACWTAALLLVFAQLPIYMLHQVEEHTGDRFRLFVNSVMFGGREALTPESVLVINLPGVWGVNLLSLYAASFLGIGWGLAGIYLTLVNGVSHIGATLGLRRYNPGLWTSLALFLPVGGLALYVVNAQPGVTWLHHAAGAGVAIAIHVAIVVYVQRTPGKG